MTKKKQIFIDIQIRELSDLYQLFNKLRLQLQNGNDWGVIHVDSAEAQFTMEFVEKSNYTDSIDEKGNNIRTFQSVINEQR